MSAGLDTSYAFRKTTVHGHHLSHENPLDRKTRKILPENAVPYLTATSDPQTIDPEICKIKLDFRLHTYLTYTHVESSYGVPLMRAHTNKQADQASDGRQAAHACLNPATRDSYLPIVIKKIVEQTLTPKKTQPFVESKLNLSPDETELLQSRHKDLAFVTNFFESRLPPDGMFSVLSGSRFEWNCNATFENPDASNQFDSQLERRLAPFLKQLQSDRLEKGESPEESTLRLVHWLHSDFDKSITNLQERLVRLGSCFQHFQAMRALELGPLAQEGFSCDDFAAYLTHTEAFLAEYTTLRQKKEGCPSTKKLKWVRNDIKFLQKLVKMAKNENLPLDEVRSFFLSNRKHLLAAMEFPVETMRTKHTLFLQEASYQREAVSVYSEPCTIPSLKKLLFGVMENGSGVSPHKVN